jgi:hypothetical protein
LGKLLGDPSVWDDTPARPRLLLRGLVGLVSGVVVGGLVAAAVTPRPGPVPPPPAAPSRRDTPTVPVDAVRLANITTSAGPMLMVRSGSLESTNPDGTDRRVVAQDVGPRAVVPGRDGSAVVQDHGDVFRYARDGRRRRLTPSGFAAGGLAGGDRGLLACAERPAAGAPGPAWLLPAGGRPRTVRVGCPVAWAAAADVVAGTGGPWERGGGPGEATAGATVRGTSVLAGPAGGPLRTLLDPAGLRAAAGPRAAVDGLALSPDGKLAAVAAGSPGGPWTVLVVPVAGGPPPAARIRLADGYEPAWLGWSNRQGTVTLAVAALDRRGGLAGATLDARRGDGYLLAWDAGTRATRVLLSGPPMVAADGFAWAADGETVGVSSAASGLTLVLQVDQVHTTAGKAAGTLVAWPGRGGP